MIPFPFNEKPIFFFILVQGFNDKIVALEITTGFHFRLMKTNFIFYFFTGWNDKIVALDKLTWFHFSLMKTNYLFSFGTGHKRWNCRPKKDEVIPFPFNGNQVSFLFWYRVERNIVALKKKLSLEKTTWFHFRLMKTNYLFYFFTGWNDKIVALKKNDMIPFPFNENQFFFLFLLGGTIKLSP